MQNFFSFLGFIFTSMLCGALFFILLGRDKTKASPDLLSAGGDRTEESLDMPEPLAMTPIAEEGRRGAGRKGKKSPRAQETPAIENDEAASDSDLKQLYNDAGFVQKTVRAWKDRVREASEAHNLRPQALLAHVVVQCYLDRGYGERQFQRDLGAHAGDRVMSAAAAAQRYPYGWSVNYLATKYDLLQHFPARQTPKIAIAGASPTSASAKNVVKSGSARKTTTEAPERRLGAGSPRESTLRDMVAQQYGFQNWTELQQRARPSIRAQAEKKVLGMKPAMMIR